MRFRFTIRAILFPATCLSMLFGASVWLYHEYYLPRQPIAWHEYSAERIEEYIAAGRPVLLLVSLNESIVSHFDVAKLPFDYLKSRQLVREHGILCVNVDLMKITGADKDNLLRMLGLKFIPAPLIAVVNPHGSNQVRLKDGPTTKEELYRWLEKAFMTQRNA